jgi:hypothetical protein
MKRRILSEQQLISGDIQTAVYRRIDITMWYESGYFNVSAYTHDARFRILWQSFSEYSRAQQLFESFGV